MAESSSFTEEVARGANFVVDRLIAFATGTTPAMVIAAAVFAYLNQSVIRFIDPYRAYGGAMVAGLALVLLVASMTVRRDFFGIIVGFGGFVLGTIWIGDALDEAVKRAVINDQRCYRIEVEMLSASPSRGDLPDLYQAFGCRPMTNLYATGQPAKR